MTTTTNFKMAFKKSSPFPGLMALFILLVVWTSRGCEGHGGSGGHGGGKPAPVFAESFTWSAGGDYYIKGVQTSAIPFIGQVLDEDVSITVWTSRKTVMLDLGLSKYWIFENTSYITMPYRDGDGIQRCYKYPTYNFTFLDGEAYKFTRYQREEIPRIPNKPLLFLEKQYMYSGSWLDVGGGCTPLHGNAYVDRKTRRWRIMDYWQYHAQLQELFYPYGIVMRIPDDTRVQATIVLDPKTERKPKLSDITLPLECRDAATLIDYNKDAIERFGFCNSTSGVAVPLKLKEPGTWGPPFQL